MKTKIRYSCLQAVDSSVADSNGNVAVYSESTVVVFVVSTTRLNRLGDGLDDVYRLVQTEMHIQSAG